MMTANNHVYIAYRRGVGGLVATAALQALSGIDVLMDVESVSGQQMESVLLNQIAARPYFVLVLTPGTLDGCAESGDWLRMQIEQAANTHRVIVPLVSPNFNAADLKRVFGSNPLGEKIASAEGIVYNVEAFGEAIAALYKRLTPQTSASETSSADQAVLEKLKKTLAALPTLPKDAVRAQKRFENAFTRKRDDWDGRIEDYTKAIELYPDFADAYARRGANFDVKGDLESALIDCNEAIERKPYSEAAYVNRGIIRQKKNELNGAIADYNEALRLNPQLAPAYFNRGIARYLKNDFAGAVSDHSEAIRINPAFTSYHYHRGLSKMALRDLDGAIADYDEAIRLNPNIPEVYYNRGLAQMYNKNYPAAVKDWSEAIRQNPDFVAAYYNRGLIRAGLRDLNGTIDDMTKVLGTLPDTPEVRQVRQQIAEVRKLKRRVETGSFEDDEDSES